MGRRDSAASASPARASPRLTEVWKELADVALLLNRHDVALDAYRHLIVLEPAEPHGYLGAAEVLLKERRLGAARARALEAAALATDNDRRDAASRGAAHALVARVALAQRDADGAREQATLAQQADSGLAMPAFVEGRILYDEGKYEEALPAFEEAVAAARKPGATPIPELHFYAGETLMRLETAAGGRSGIPERSCSAFRRTSAPGQPSRRSITRRDSWTPRTAPSPTCSARHPRRRPTPSPRACGPHSASPARRRRSAPKHGARSPKAARAPPTNN